MKEGYKMPPWPVIALLAVVVVIAIIDGRMQKPADPNVSQKKQLAFCIPTALAVVVAYAMLV